MKRMARLILPLGLVAATLVACRGADGPTAPLPGDGMLSPGSAALGQGASPHLPAQGRNEKVKTKVKPLMRLSPVGQRMEVTQVIGPNGGEIAIPSLGFKMQFPARAVSANTTIRIVVKPGKEVAYEFYPHMGFKYPVTVVQELAYTVAANDVALQNSIIGAYFPGELESSFTGPDRGFVRVEELRTVHLEAGRKRFLFTVEHFSGYLASSGRSTQGDHDDDK